MRFRTISLFIELVSFDGEEGWGWPALVATTVCGRALALQVRPLVRLCNVGTRATHRV